MKITLVLIAALALATDTIGQCCSSGRCTVQSQPEKNWYYVGEYPNGYYAVKQPDGQWVSRSHPRPEAKPAVKKQEEVKNPIADNYGVDTSKLTGKDEYHLHTETGTSAVSKEQAHKLVAEKLQDDSTKLRITVIGDDGTSKKVIADIQTLAKDINDWAILRGYPPGHWALQPGFVTSGAPTIYCQAPSGKVLHRQDNYDGGAEQAVEALRKAKAGYDSRKDPDLRKTPPPQPNDNGKLLNYGIAAVAGAGVMTLMKRRKP